MPRPRLTERQRRERALLSAMGRASGDLGLRKDYEVATLLGMRANTYAYRKSDPLKKWGFDDVSKLARTLRLTGAELCAICGIPYTQNEGSERS